MPKSPIPVKDDELGTRELLLTLNKRLAVVAVAGGTGIIAMATLFFFLLPLKEIKPYIVEVDKGTGAAYVPPQSEAVLYRPRFDTISFFLRRFVQDAYTINQYNTIQVLDPRAREYLRGNTAISEYADFLKKDQKFERMAKDPSLVRDVAFGSVTPVAGTNNGVIIEVKLTTRSASGTQEERRLVTLYYEIFPPETRRDVEINPIGIFVTDFKIGESNG